MPTRAKSSATANCSCVARVPFSLSICILYSLLCNHQAVSSFQMNKTQQKEQALDIQQEQIELRMLPEENFNEINRIQDKCAAARQNLDTCSAQLIEITQTGLQNMDEIDNVMCPKFKGITACIRNNTHCYKPFEKQIINWILTSTRRMNYKRCNNDTEKQKFLRLTQACFSESKNPMSKCMTSYISSLEAIANLNKFAERLSEDDIQIQLSCCANMRFKQCVMTDAKNHCKPVADSLRKLQRANSISSQRVIQKYLQRSTFDMMDNLKQSLDSMALTGPEFICQSVDEAFCQAKFDGKFRGQRPKHKSILPAMISIYSNKPE